MSNRNRTLDILRALAIVLVVHCHAAGAVHSRDLLPFLLGGKGVDLFFVLSGWLLGRQLLVEMRDTGTINLRRFWYRRWLRTLPAYYFVLGVILLWQVWKRSSAGIAYSYLFFGQNYLSNFPYMGISWSLCVEEHFYLMVAPLLLLFFRFPWTARTMLPVLLALPTLCRVMGWYHDTRQTHVRYDQCASGVLLAYFEVFYPRIWNRLCQVTPLLIVAALLFASSKVLSRINPQGPISDGGELAWLLVFAPFVILANSGPFWKHRIYCPGSQYLAERAYAIYLLHSEVLVLMKFAPSLPFPVFVGIAWILTLLVSEVLYRLVERPALRAREFLSVTRSSEKQNTVASQKLALPPPPIEEHSATLLSTTLAHTQTGTIP
jgi:peptidoglycan/LPS O-acetylase OafA/YrhL